MARGGARPGAGRKTLSPRVTVSMRVKKETKETLEEARARGLSVGQFVDELVDEYKGRIPKK